MSCVADPNESTTAMPALRPGMWRGATRRFATKMSRHAPRRILYQRVRSMMGSASVQNRIKSVAQCNPKQGRGMFVHTHTHKRRRERSTKGRARACTFLAVTERRGHGATPQGKKAAPLNRHDTHKKMKWRGQSHSCSVLESVWAMCGEAKRARQARASAVAARGTQLAHRVRRLAAARHGVACVRITRPGARLWACGSTGEKAVR